MKEIWNWLITSSADPAKTGLLMRGFLVWAVAQAVDLSTLACTLLDYCLDLGPLEGLIDPIVGFTIAGLTLVSYAMMIVGAVRKVWLNRWTAFGKQL